ncbi:MAG: hypothetical protein R3F45_01170 [Gammaproteobacteria bacterium]
MSMLASRATHATRTRTRPRIPALVFSLFPPAPGSGTVRAGEPWAFSGGDPPPTAAHLTQRQPMIKSAELNRVGRFDHEMDRRDRTLEDFA